MLVSIIVAIGKNNQIGLNNKIPWNVKEDMKHFKNLTTGHHIIMGRRTFESIGTTLPNRTNLIITKNKNFLKPNDSYIFDCSYKAIEFAKKRNENEIFVCGGTTIYKFFLENNLIDRIYLTRVDFNGDADTYFPNINYNDWNVVKTGEFIKNEVNEYSGIFETLSKKVLDF